MLTVCNFSGAIKIHKLWQNASVFSYKNLKSRISGKEKNAKNGPCRTALSHSWDKTLGSRVLFFIFFCALRYYSSCSPWWSSDNLRMLLVLVLEFQSRRGEILSSYWQKK